MLLGKVNMYPLTLAQKQHLLLSFEKNLIKRLRILFLLQIWHIIAHGSQTKNNKRMNPFTACNTQREHVGFVNANASVFSPSLDCMDTVVIDMCKGSREAF